MSHRYFQGMIKNLLRNFSKLFSNTVFVWKIRNLTIPKIISNYNTNYNPIMIVIKKKNSNYSTIHHITKIIIKKFLQALIIYYKCRKV